MTHFPTLARASRLFQRWITRRLLIRLAAIVVILYGTFLVGSYWLKARAARFRRIAAEHVVPFPGDGEFGVISGHEGDDRIHYFVNGKEIPYDVVDRHLWHLRLQKKYLDASLRPWLPVEPDPPP
ncbi:hypothetical protein [Singulisphaera sp. PoT]|uniref:hypothetical protein n=1 Tax=Singulisphaera sp. PoT TaxID=3411797 RepID=UPI003BF5468A